MNEKQKIVDAGDLRKYRTELPNIYDDADLDVYEFRLLAHYKRVGTCTESTKTTARKCHMSTGKITEGRRSLSIKKWISVLRVDLEGNNYSYSITVLDRWLENFQRYSPSLHADPPHQVNAPPSPGERPPSPGETKKEPFKKEPIEEGSAGKSRDPRSTHPAILAIREVTSRYPSKDVYDLLIRAIGETPNIQDLKTCFEAWRAKDWKPTNYGWVTEWYVSGIPANGHNGNGQVNGSGAMARVIAKMEAVNGNH